MLRSRCAKLMGQYICDFRQRDTSKLVLLGSSDFTAMEIFVYTGINFEIQAIKFPVFALTLLARDVIVI